MTAVENKILSFTNLVKKTDYDTNVGEIEKRPTDHTHDKYITTPEFNMLTAEKFAERLKKANLVTKTHFDNKLLSLNTKIVLNKTRDLSIEKELEKSNTFNISYFRGKIIFKKMAFKTGLSFNQWVNI